MEGEGVQGRGKNWGFFPPFFSLFLVLLSGRAGLEGGGGHRKGVRG